MRMVLTDLDLSIRVSVPTSRRPMAEGGIWYLSRRDLVAVSARCCASVLNSGRQLCPQGRLHACCTRQTRFFLTPSSPFSPSPDRQASHLPPAPPSTYSTPHTPVRRVERERTVEQERVDVLAVVAEGHALDTQPNGVLARRDAIEALKVRLVDRSEREVGLDGVCCEIGGREGQMREGGSARAAGIGGRSRRTDTDVLRSGGRVGRKGSEAGGGSGRHREIERKGRGKVGQRRGRDGECSERGDRVTGGDLSGLYECKQA